MPREPEVTLKVHDAAVRAAIQKLPIVANQEMNRGLQRIASGFYKAFRPRLQGAGIKVRRRLSTGRSKGGVPAVASAMGFRAKIDPRRGLEGKTLTLWSRSPVIYAHEFGAQIRGNPLLAIGEPPRLSRRGGYDRAKIGKVIRRVRQVTIKPKLGFYDTWTTFAPSVRIFLAGAAARIVKRANKLDREPVGKAVVTEAA